MPDLNHSSKEARGALLLPGELAGRDAPRDSRRDAGATAAGARAKGG